MNPHAAAPIRYLLSADPTTTVTLKKNVQRYR
jgi:hypothetical protein